MTEIMTKSSFSVRIRSFRVAYGLTQQEVADAVGVCRTAVTNWESGIQMPTIHALMALAKLFQCSLDELLQGDGQ